VSLQVANPEVRRRLIGRHAQRGLESLERLLAAGIEFHAQIVLVPGENDGAVLEETLEWAYGRSGIVEIGIVPLGYTRFQDAFDHSFNDAEASRGLLQTIAPFQDRAQRERGNAWVFAADEFYRNAYRGNLLENIPPTSYYGDFGMFEDGIGIIRSTLDDWESMQREGAIERAAAALREARARAVMVVGCAQREFLDPLVMRSNIGDVFEPLYVQNVYFGGNVDVTGLLTGADIAQAVRNEARAVRNEARAVRNEIQELSEWPEQAVRDGAQTPSQRLVFLIPRVVFNDDGLTLDDMTRVDMETVAGQSLHVVSCSPLEYFEEIVRLARQLL